MKKLIILLLAILPLLGASQVSISEKKETIEKILDILEKRYIFPDVADQMTNVVLASYESGKYDTIVSAEEFAHLLTSELQQVSKDLHLKIQVDEQRDSLTEKTDQEKEWIKNLMMENNYGIKSKKILEGNIGYLEIPMFGPLDLCADTLISSVGFIKNTDALIIDLRSCRGSLDENTIPFLCSYFFDEPVHLFDFYTRETNSTKQFWTYAWVPGEKYVDKPIYILTSGRTFSGGEELAYDLKHLNRAEIVGEITKGGANPTDYVRVSSTFCVSVPFMRSVNAVTQTNWEQRGVQPDILVKSNRALYSAHVNALQKLYNIAEDNSRRIHLKEILQQLEARQPEFLKITFKLNGFDDAKEVFVAGSFNSWAAKNTPLKRENGAWMAEVECEPGEVSYQFIVDGLWMNDPENPETITENGYKNSYIMVR